MVRLGFFLVQFSPTFSPRFNPRFCLNDGFYLVFFFCSEQSAIELTDITIKMTIRPWVVKLWDSPSVHHISFFLNILCKKSQLSLILVLNFKLQCFRSSVFIDGLLKMVPCPTFGSRPTSWKPQLIVSVSFYIFNDWIALNFSKKTQTKIVSTQLFSFWNKNKQSFNLWNKFNLISILDF